MGRASDRVAYAHAGAAARQALQRAATLRLTGQEWRVLAAVIAATATWSRLVDRCYTDEIAAFVNMPSKRTRQILAELKRQGIILYQPAQGRGHKSLIGLPASSSAADDNGRVPKEVTDELADYVRA